MKSFLLPVGRSAGASLPTLFSAMSCGATVPVAGLDVFFITDDQADPVLPPLVRDLNQACSLLHDPDNAALFPSSFTYLSFRPMLPSLRSLTEDPASAALIGALRGKGLPLSYKTDREAVEWAFSMLLSGGPSGTFSPFFTWIKKIEDARSAGEEVRLAVLCDLCDPFSVGATFALIRYLHEASVPDPADLMLFCLAVKPESAGDFHADMLSGSLQALAGSNLIGRPDRAGTACADAAWFLSMPSSLVASGESFRILYTVLARRLAAALTSGKKPAPGLHTVSLPGIITFQALGDQAKTFASFLHASAWLLSDLFPALSSYADHPPALSSLTPNTRNGLFRRLFQGESVSDSHRETLRVLNRAFSAVLSEILSLIRFMPDQLRLAEASDPLWQRVVDACGRTVTVASEYDVSKAEAEEGGILNVKPVHRVSLADTEEEKLEHLLDDIAAQLKAEESARDTVFSASGGCWAMLALQDCLSRCRDALEKAREQQRIMSSNPDADHLSSAALARRVRLLEAAVSRCEQDLSALDVSAFSSSASVPGLKQLSPFSGQLLDSAAAEKLFSLLAGSGDTADSVRKELFALLPALLDGFTLPDGKTLFRQLLSCCKADASRDPLAVLLSSVLSVSNAQTALLRFVSSGNVPSVPLLPDLYPSGPVLTVSALLPLLPVYARQSSGSVSEKRGILTMLLLRQYRRRTSEEAALSMDRFTSDDSPVLHAWLASREADNVWIISLGQENNRLPFALLLPGRDLVPAHVTSFHTGLVPAFAAPWFDSDGLSFTDPCALLGESDLALLTELLARMVEPSSDPLPDSLRSFLTDFLGDLEESRKQVRLPEGLSLRLKAAFGLRLLPAFGPSLVRTVCTYERYLITDDLAARLLDRVSFPPSSCAVPDEISYLYRDVPFARENSRTLLESVPLPAEKWILSLLTQECSILSRASDDYHDALVRELSLLLERYPDAMPEARQAAQDLLEKAKQPVTDTDTELVWPWDPQSPSVITILSESLGRELAVAAVRPFSDMLILFPARGRDVIGDTLLSSMCLIPPSGIAQDTESTAPVAPDAVLPPLSGEFCSALCRLPEGRTLFRPDLLTFERKTDGSVRVTLTLEGSFTVRLCRDYTEEDILHLYSHDIPTLAVWPNLPFAPEDWHAYFIYASMPDFLRLTATGVSDDTVELPEGEKRAVCRSSFFPLFFSFFREGRSAGTLPNILPAPVIDKTEPYTACLDFGSVGTSVVFSVGHRRCPLQGPVMVRTLINNPAQSRDLLRKEFLPAVPVSALLPTASRIFRNVPGSAPLPFEDGIVLMSSDLQDVLSIPSGALYTCLKWEEEKGRSVSLCLHQIMLMAALQARSDGASSLAWRFSVPDEMARTGRERLLSLFTSLAGQVAEESGFTFPDRIPPVTFAAESSALGAYFRLCASEDTRGGFMVLDIGACTADISLFLRGREQAVRTCQIPLGVHYMLLPALLRNPGILQQDLGYIQDPSFRQDLALLEQILSNAKADPSALRHSRLALDNFIADRFTFLLPALMQNPVTDMPTRIGSVLLLHFSYLMMLSGLILLQIAADPNKNDFLPEQMSLCLSGRGSLLPEFLPDGYKQALWHFLTMFRNRRVASLSFLFSSEKKMEIPVGLSVLQDVYTDLPPASAVPAAISVRPEELLPQFLLRFAKEFPASAELLFHGFFTGDFYHPFTPYGESVVSEALSVSFTEQTALRPFDSLSAWIGSLLERVDTSAF